MLVPFVPVNSFSAMMGHFLSETSTKQRIKRPVQEYYTVPPVSFEPATPESQV